MHLENALHPALWSSWGKYINVVQPPSTFQHQHQRQQFSTQHPQIHFLIVKYSCLISTAKMRSAITTLFTAFLLLFFGTTTSAYKYRMFPYTVTCDGNRPDVNRWELQKGARDAIRGYRRRYPEYYEARKSDKAGNCKDLPWPMYKWDIGINDLIIYYAFEVPTNTLWHCSIEVDETKEVDKEHYFDCANNYERHTWGADEPSSYDEGFDDGEQWHLRTRRS
ncbi:hypothetical protein BKA81DRAFT_344593 [Phyllosticta paracitricarpa]|uniref:Uncharacterized protein n=1 Tax=Phyllosticta paracitricarpa TaxID=2016321 RepID=A0ABR1NFA2_9PEZI